MSRPVRVAVSGANGNIGYALIFRLALARSLGQTRRQPATAGSQPVPAKPWRNDHGTRRLRIPNPL